MVWMNLSGRIHGLDELRGVAFALVEAVLDERHARECVVSDAVVAHPAITIDSLLVAREVHLCSPRAGR
jgi:hypothetical protein